LPREIIDALKSKAGRHYFTETEKEFIKNSAYNGIKYLAWIINVPPQSIHKQAQLMGISVARKDYCFYSEEEIELITTEGIESSDNALAKKMSGRSPSAIQHLRLIKGVKKRKIIHWKNFPRMKLYLVKNQGKKTYRQMAKHLGLRYYQVKTMFERMRNAKK